MTIHIKNILGYSLIWAFIALGVLLAEKADLLVPLPRYSLAFACLGGSMLAMQLINVILGMSFRGGFIAIIYLLHMALTAPSFSFAYAINPSGFLSLPGGGWVEIPLAMALSYWASFPEFKILGRHFMIKD